MKVALDEVPTRRGRKLASAPRCTACGKRIRGEDVPVLIHGAVLHEECSFYRPKERQDS